MAVDTLAGPIPNPLNDSIYYLLTASSWTEAQAKAVSLGGNLVTFDSPVVDGGDAEEAAWVYSTFGNWGGVPRNLWIGFYDPDPVNNSKDAGERQEEFIWVTDRIPLYTNWSPVEPNNPQSTDLKPDPELYVHIWNPSDVNGGTWNNYLDAPQVLNVPIHGVVEVVPNNTFIGALESNPAYKANKLTDIASKKEISDALNGYGEYLLLRMAAGVVGDVQKLLTDGLFYEISEFFKGVAEKKGPLSKAAQDAIKKLPGVRTAITLLGFDQQLREIAKNTGREPLDLVVLGIASVGVVYDGLLPFTGIGDTVVANLEILLEKKPTPQSNTTRALRQPNSTQNTEALVNRNFPTTHNARVIQPGRINGSSKNDRLLGSFRNEYLFGNAGNDFLQGGQGWDILIGGSGNDQLVGGDAADTLNGNGRKFTVGEVDRLTGGAGVDIFVLGDPNRVYYDDRNRRTAGTKDYAVITDFNFYQDFIVLKGKMSDYIFKGNRIFLNTDGVKGLGRNDELIAQVKGAANLNPIDIMFI